MFCPYCKKRNETQRKLNFKRDRIDLGADIWSNGYYRCDECGLLAPKNVMEDIEHYLNTKTINNSKQPLVGMEERAYDCEHCSIDHLGGKCLKE